MRILLIEDQENKISIIKNAIYEVCDDVSCSIVCARYLEDARRKILSESFDLIIFDIYLPLSSKEPSSIQDVSTEIINEFSQSKNYQAESIAITQYDIDQIENIAEFNQVGVTVVKFSEDNSDWKRSLLSKISRVLDKVSYDFLIFCALTKERSAYSGTEAKLGDLKTIFGLNCQDININGFIGLCITPHRPGLVDMAITASKAIEFFQPKIVAMSGICAGVSGEARLLDLIIADPCWEYQTGKYKDNEFKQEPYQSSLDARLKVELEQLCESDDVLNKIKEGLYETELKYSRMFLGPVSSGSAVIADKDKMYEIGQQHRKMAGLEMEMYSFYEAAHQSLSIPLYFGVKSVVDLGDSSKSDHLHTAASILSARCVVCYLSFKLPHLS